MDIEIDEFQAEYYIFHNYDKENKKHFSNLGYLNSLSEELSKMNLSIEKFIKKKTEINLTKDKTSSKDNIVNELFRLLQKTFYTTFKEIHEIINMTLNHLKGLKESIKSCNKKYNEFLISQKKFNNKLNELKTCKNNFYESAKKAEKFFYESAKKEENFFYDKKKLKENCENNLKSELEKYKNKLKEANDELKLFNDFQKSMFEANIKLDIQYNEVFSYSLSDYLEHQLILNELSKKIKNKILNLNTKSNNQRLKEGLNAFEEIKEINFEQYKTYIDFNCCKDRQDLITCFQTYDQMEKYIGNYVEIDFSNEVIKFDIKKEIGEIFHLDDKITDKEIGILKNHLKMDLGQIVFMNELSLLRSSGFYEKSKIFIETIGNGLNKILEAAEKSKDYEKAKNCIILSQTFYYYDINKTKIFIFAYIKHNKWLKGTNFWRNFIEIMLKKEFNKTSKNKLQNLNDILLTQLLPYINNMKELEIDQRIIVKIVDEFLEKYNYLNEESYNTLFTILNSSPEEIEKLRKAYKDNPNLEKELIDNNDGSQEEKIIEVKEENNIGIDINENNNKK